MNLGDARQDQDEQRRIIQGFGQRDRPVTLAQGAVVLAAHHAELVHQESGGTHLSGDVAQLLGERDRFPEPCHDRGELAERQQGVPELEAEIDRRLERGAARGHTLERGARLLQQPHRLSIGSPLRRLTRREAKIAGGLVPGFRVSEVKAERVEVRLEAPSVMCLERLGYAPVKPSPPRGQEVPVDDLPHTVVPEREALADLPQEPSPHELFDGGRRLRLAQAGRPLQHGEVDLAPGDRCHREDRTAGLAHSAEAPDHEMVDLIG